MDSSTALKCHPDFMEGSMPHSTPMLMQSKDPSIAALQRDDKYRYQLNLFTVYLRYCYSICTRNRFTDGLVISTWPSPLNT